MESATYYIDIYMLESTAGHIIYIYGRLQGYVYIYIAESIAEAKYSKIEAWQMA